MKNILKLIISFLFGKREVIKKETYIPVEDIIIDDIVNLINKQRESIGLNVLISEVKLNALAKKKVEQMITDKLISHNGFVQESIDSNSVMLLENVGYKFKTQLGFFNAYMKSESHRENILHPTITHIGSYTKDLYHCNLFAQYK